MLYLNSLAIHSFSRPRCRVARFHVDVNIRQPFSSSSWPLLFGVLPRRSPQSRRASLECSGGTARQDDTGSPRFGYDATRGRGLPSRGLPSGKATQTEDHGCEGAFRLQGFRSCCNAWAHVRTRHPYRPYRLYATQTPTARGIGGLRSEDDQRKQS